MSTLCDVRAQGREGGYIQCHPSAQVAEGDAKSPLLHSWGRSNVNQVLDQSYHPKPSPTGHQSWGQSCHPKPGRAGWVNCHSKDEHFVLTIHNVPRMACCAASQPLLLAGPLDAGPLGPLRYGGQQCSVATATVTQTRHTCAHKRKPTHKPSGQLRQAGATLCTWPAAARSSHWGQRAPMPTGTVKQTT